MVLCAFLLERLEPQITATAMEMAKNLQFRIQRVMVAWMTMAVRTESDGSGLA